MFCHQPQANSPEMICHHLLIEFNDTTPEAPVKKEPPSKPKIPDKLLQLFKQFKSKWTWRTKQLALPKIVHKQKEDIPAPKTASPKPSKAKIQKPDECPMRVDHMARPPIR